MKKLPLLLLISLLLMLWGLAKAQTVYLEDANLCIEPPAGAITFYAGHVDEAAASKYMGKTAGQVEDYMKQNGIALCAVSNDPYYEIAVYSFPTGTDIHWKDLGYADFPQAMDELKKREPDYETIHCIKPLMTNQTRSFFMDISFEHNGAPFYVQKYHTVVNGDYIVISVKSNEPISGAQADTLQKAVDSIRYNAANAYAQADAISNNHGKSKTVTMEGFSISLPESWVEELPSGKSRPTSRLFTCGSMQLHLTSEDSRVNSLHVLTQDERRNLPSLETILKTHPKVELDTYSMYLQAYEKFISAFTPTLEDAFQAQTSSVPFDLPADLLALQLENSTDLTPRSSLISIRNRSSACQERRIQWAKMRMCWYALRRMPICTSACIMGIQTS